MSTPRITFAYPDFRSLGIEYVMAVCLDAGCDVACVNYRAHDPYLGRKPDNTDRVAGRIADTRPDIAAFSCVTDNYQAQVRCATALKHLCPNVLTVFGGVHPTAVPYRVLRNDAVDCVAIGEAEVSFRRFVQACADGGRVCLPREPVKGILFKRDGGIVGEMAEGPLADLDALPYPHDEPYYSSHPEDVGYSVITTRGCPNACAYCFNDFYYSLRGRKVIRQRSVGNVIDELTRAKARYGYRYLDIVDDCFTWNKTWLKEFCPAYREHVGVPFACQGIAQSIDAEVAGLLAEAGCSQIEIGCQSVSEETCRQVLNRRSDNEEIAQAVMRLQNAGIFVQVDHLMGIPGDTPRVLEDALEFYNACRPNCVSVFWLKYYPKTRIVETARQRGLLTERDIERIEDGIALTDHNIHCGGSLAKPGWRYSVGATMNYLPLLPRRVVRFLVRTRLYRALRFGGFCLSTALPRVLISATHRKAIIDRAFVRQFFAELGKLIPMPLSGIRGRASARKKASTGAAQ